MAVHTVTVVAFNEGEETYRNTFKGRKHTRAEMLRAMATITTTGEVLTTEENADTWAVWSYNAGDKFLNWDGTIQK